MEYSKFEFRVFFLLDWLPYYKAKEQSTQVFTYTWRKNRWIHAFSKGICVKHSEQELGLQVITIMQSVPPRKSSD